MKDHRRRQPGEPEYLLEIGTAVWTFAILEWNAAWCCERIENNCLPQVAERTAGGIAKKLIALIQELPVCAERDELSADAARFQELVQTRNRIMHGRPSTDGDRQARLSDDGQFWTPELLQDAADSFSECGSRLNKHLHGWLATPSSRQQASAVEWTPSLARS